MNSPVEIRPWNSLQFLCCNNQHARWRSVIQQQRYPNATEDELRRLPPTWGKGGSDVRSLTHWRLVMVHTFATFILQEMEDEQTRMRVAQMDTHLLLMLDVLVLVYPLNKFI